MLNKIKTELDTYVRKSIYNKVSFLRYIISTIQYKSEKLKKEINNDFIIYVLKNELNNINEEITNAISQNRLDIISEKEIQKEIVSKYLPIEMTEDETILEINNLLKKLNIKTEKEFGLVIKELKLQFKNNLNMEIVNRVLKSTISKYLKNESL